MNSLVIDTSHKENFIGLFNENENWLKIENFSQTPYEALTYAFKNILAVSKISIDSIEKLFIPCAPGSTLGIRMTQMFIHGLLASLSHKPAICTYNGLFLSALHLADEIKGLHSPKLITENGRTHWSLIDLKALDKPIIASLSEDELAAVSGELYYIRQSKTWKMMPSGAVEINYLPEKFLPIFKEWDQSKIDHTQLMPYTTTYKKWHSKLTI